MQQKLIAVRPETELSYDAVNLCPELQSVAEGVLLLCHCCLVVVAVQQINQHLIFEKLSGAVAGCRWVPVPVWEGSSTADKNDKIKNRKF